MGREGGREGGREREREGGREEGEREGERWGGGVEMNHGLLNMRVLKLTKRSQRLRSKR
jgi:hypothetical protein